MRSDRVGGGGRGSSLFSRPKCGLICPFHIPRYTGPPAFLPITSHPRIRYSTVMHTPAPASPEGVFLDVIRRKILSLLLHACYSQSPLQADFTPHLLMVFFDFRFLKQQLKVDWGLALCTLYLCLHLKVALLYTYTL
jgi:hypothetical protein